MLPRSTAEAIVELSSSIEESTWHDLKNFLVKMREDEALVRHHPDVKLEVAIFDQGAKCLSHPSLDFVEGWPYDITERIYRIKNYTPGGGTSAAGACWLTKTWLNIGDTSKSDDFWTYRDHVNAAYSPTKSILCIPLLNPADPDGHPLGVLSIAASRTYEFSTDDVACGLVYAKAIAAYLSHHTMPKRASQLSPLEGAEHR